MKVFAISLLAWIGLAVAARLLGVSGNIVYWSAVALGAAWVIVGYVWLLGATDRSPRLPSVPAAEDRPQDQAHE